MVNALHIVFFTPEMTASDIFLGKTAPRINRCKSVCIYIKPGGFKSL